MESELLGRASKVPYTSTTAATITREVDRAARIVRSLLRLARRADTTPTRVQMNDLVHDVAEIRQRVLRTESVEFRTTLDQRSEEHTSELQSRLHLVCRLLLEKKK